MPKKIAFLVFYHKYNKFSFNALIGALETSEIFNYIDIYFIKKREDLFPHLEGLIEKYEKVVLGISFFTTQLWEIYGLIKTIRKKFGRKIFCIAGGSHPTGDPKGSLLKIGFDLVFIGEGEESLIEFLENLRNNTNYHTIKGIAYLDKDKKYFFTGKRKPVDLDKYPPFPIRSNKFGSIEITRGCPYVCYFCQTPYILGAIPRHRSIKSICKYIEIIKENNLTDIRFISPNAFSYGSLDGKTINVPKLEELLLKIKRIIGTKGRIFLGSFPSEVRPEHVNEDTLGLVKKYCDNDNITIGGQSGSQRILDMCHRGHTVKDLYKAVELTLKAKIKPNVDFIFGLPKETEEDVKLTLNVMKDLALKGARIHTHSFMPLPQTPFANEPVSRISLNVVDVINDLTSKGFAFGNWREQEKLAIKIAKYLKTKKLK